MKLQEKLSKIKKESIATKPPELVTTLLAGIHKLQESGLVEQAISVGRTLPEFTLPDEQGRAVSSKELLTKGPLIISFYRGIW